MTIFLKLLFLFVIQSFVFKAFLSKKGEDDTFIWDLYFASNIIAVIITFIIGNFLGIYFPIYFFALFAVFIVFRLLSHWDLSLGQILQYFALNVYVALLGHLIFSLSSDLIVIVTTLSLCVITLYVLMKNMLLGMYLLPLFWYISTLVRNTNFLNDALVAIRSLHISSLYGIDHIVVLGGMLVLAILEFAVIKALRESSVSLEDEYQDILRFRAQKQHTSQVLRVGI